MKSLFPAFMRLAPRALAPLLGGLLVQVPAAQLFGPEKIVSTDADYPTSVLSADLDGDGDQDVLFASLYDKIAWHENLDGLGAFGPQLVITSAALRANAVFAADLDGDGDQDVLSAGVDDKIAWYENLDGLGAFGPRQLITSVASDAWLDVFAADLDGDGDQDVLSAEYGNNQVAWYENTDGLGAFGPPRVITTVALHAWDVFAADLDGDGDQDVLSASMQDNKIAWYENLDGLGTFGPQLIITTAAHHACSVFAADLDGDGDQDVLSASETDHRIAWYENTDGLGAFGPRLIITSAALGASSVFAADLDGDGDTDVLSSSAYDSKLAWYENLDGLGAFGPQLIITTAALGATSIFAADLDGDGDTDVLSPSVYDDKIIWFENLLITVPTVTPYGCGVNPTGSLTVLSGVPTIGTTIALGIDNPLGTQGVPSSSFLALCTAPDPAFPCGTPLAGLGMAGPGAVGELLVSVAKPNPLDVFAGPSWTGPGAPASISIPIPPDPGLLGVEVWFQGFLWDSLPGAPVPFGLTNGIKLKIGS